MKKAFTLIELLVVVLIIGILASVAVPQYQKAVARSRAAELRIVIKAIHDASKAYYLANGVWLSQYNHHVMPELSLELGRSVQENMNGVWHYLTHWKIKSTGNDLTGVAFQSLHDNCYGFISLSDDSFFTAYNKDCDKYFNYTIKQTGSSEDHSYYL